DTLTQVAGRNTDTPSLSLSVGQTAELPQGMGTVTLDGVSRFAALDIRYDPTKGWVLAFSLLVLAGLLASLLVPRRRLWMKVRAGDDARLGLEFAGLARGDDPALGAAVRQFADTVAPPP